MLVGLDTETALIERGLLAPPLACVTYALEGQLPKIIHHTQAEPLIRRFLVGTNVYLVTANGAYDAAVWCAEFPGLIDLTFEAYDQGRILDIQVAEKLLDHAGDAYIPPDKPYSLAALSKAYGYPEMDKSTWRLKFGELRELPLEEWPQGAIDYALGDADRPLDIFLEQLQREPNGVLGQLGRHSRNAFWLHLQSCWGVHTSPTHVEKFRQQVKRAIDEARGLLLVEGLLREEGGRYVKNIKAAAAYMEHTCFEQGRKVKRTAKGGVSLDHDACTATGDPVLEAYTTWTSQNGLAKRLEVLAQGYELPLQSRYDYPKETSRSSCKHPRYPLVGDQLQNAPKIPGYRESIVPRPGTCFMIADFGGMELATIAQVCLWVVGYSRLAEMLNGGQDLHSWLGAQLLGVRYEDVVQAHHDGGPAELTQARAFGKVGNFSFWGMAGPKRIVEQARIQYGVRMTLEQATTLRRTVWAAYPEMRKYHAWINATLVRNNNSIRSLHPDPLRPGKCLQGDYRGGLNGPSAANGHFQRLGADGSNEAGWEMAKACYTARDSVLYGSRPVIFFHDEIVAEVPIDTGHECAMESKRLMETAFRKHVPDVRSDIEPVLAMCWSKKAAPTYENGRLVPWVP